MLQERMFKNLDFMVFCYKTRNFHARLIKNSKKVIFSRARPQTRISLKFKFASVTKKFSKRLIGTALNIQLNFKVIK